MRRARREFSVFSLAAIDLFCSAMGAFMVISIVLLPYFRAQQPVPQPDLKAAEELAARNARQAEESAQRAAALQQEVNQLHKQISDSSMLALFGIVTHAKSVAIVVDLSGSINDKRPNVRTRDFRPQVSNTCRVIIDGMQAGQKLQVIGFHAPDGVTPVLPAWHEAAVPLDATGKDAAKKFVTQILETVAGATPTRAAMRRAMREEVEAVFLITDGAPNEGRRSGAALCEEIAAEIKSQNNGRKEIHCVAVGEYNTEPYLTEFLMHLARENRGQFICQPDI